MIAPEALSAFILSLDEEDCAFSVFKCANQMDPALVVIYTADEAIEWIVRFLDAPERHMERFARFVWLVAMLDIELSDAAIDVAVKTQRANFERGISSSDESRLKIALMASNVLRDRVPRMQAIAKRWRDYRESVLTKDLILSYRVEMIGRDVTETLDQIRSFASYFRKDDTA